MDTQTPQPTKPVLSVSIRWKDVLRILLALALIALVFSKTSLGQVRSIAGTVSWSWLGVALLLYVGMTALKAVEYWALMRRRIPYVDVLRIVVIQNGLGNLVATSAGIASYLTLFRVEQNVGFGRSAIVFIVAKVGDLLTMSLVLLASSLLVWDRIEPLHEVVILLLLTILASLVLFMIALIFRQTFITQAERFLHWTRLERFGWMRDGLHSIRSLAAQDHLTVLQALATATVLSFCYSVLTMIYFYSRVQAFHIPIDLWPVIFIAIMMQLVSMIPVQAFGGLGVIEFSSDYLYGIFGITQVDIPAILIGMRVVYYLFNLVTLLYLPLDALLRRTFRRRDS